MRVRAIESCTRKYMFVDGTMRIVLVVLRATYGSQVVHYLITDDGLLVPISAVTGDEGALTANMAKEAKDEAKRRGLYCADASGSGDTLFHVAYADLRFNVQRERKSLEHPTSSDVADIGKAARELAKQQAKTKSVDKKIAELQEKLNDEKKLRKEAERVASREKKSAVAAMAKAAKAAKAKAGASAGGSDETALVVLQSSAAVPSDGRSSANLGELR